MENRQTEKLLASADRLARAWLSDKRYAHTVRVADTAERLAKAHNLDPEQTRLSALIHDVAREVKKDELLKLAEEWSIPLGDFERENPKLLHGPVAAELAKQALGVEDEKVLDAVREHTVGKTGMSDLSLALYLADKIEPARDYPSVEEIRSLAEESLPQTTAEALRRSIAHSEERGKPVHPSSRRMLEWLEEADGGSNERV